MFERVAIVGVGLLGGSLGMACRRRGLAREVVGVGRDNRKLAEAQRLGAVDRFTSDAPRGVAEADFIVLATPVRVIMDQLPMVRASAPAGALVTDVGSAKASIVRAAESAFDGAPIVFLGSHPMAGGEQTGAVHAREDLYEDAPCYLTPTASTPREALERLTAFWRRLGARVAVMAAERHDTIVALLSHLPHAVAVALMGALEADGEERETLRSLAGPGLLDTTRVAAGSTDMWRDIFLENRGQTLRAIDAFSGSLSALRKAIETDDAAGIERILDAARDMRRFLGEADRRKNDREAP